MSAHVGGRRLVPRWSILIYLFIFVEAKKAKKIPSVVCVEGRIMWAACVPVPASLPVSSPPQISTAAALTFGSSF